MEIYFQPNLTNKDNFLSNDESRHCIRVLRRQVGDQIIVVDGKGLKVKAAITEANPKKCLFQVTHEERVAPSSFQVHIAIAPTKSVDRMEWFIEKSVELGIQSIDFYYSKHSERRKLNLERLTKKAVSAMKQSGQAWLPELNQHKDFHGLLSSRQALDEHFVAYVDFDNPVHLMDSAQPNRSTVVLIGPEGDFSREELQLALDSGYRKVSLGDKRLRTETAGLAACHILNLLNR